MPLDELVASAATASPPQRLLCSGPRPLHCPLSNPRPRRPLSSTSSTSFLSGPSDSARPRSNLCGRECISGTSGRRCCIHNRADSSCPCSDRTIKQLHQYSKSTYRTRDLPCPSPLEAHPSCRQTSFWSAPLAPSASTPSTSPPSQTAPSSPVSATPPQPRRLKPPAMPRASAPPRCR